jgi:hypothetical protein
MLNNGCPKAGGGIWMLYLACLMDDKILVFLLEEEKISLFLLAKFGQKKAKLRIQNWKINRFWRSSIARSKPHNK